MNQKEYLFAINKAMVVKWWDTFNTNDMIALFKSWSL